MVARLLISAPQGPRLAPRLSGHLPVLYAFEHHRPVHSAGHLATGQASHPLLVLSRTVAFADPSPRLPQPFLILISVTCDRTGMPGIAGRSRSAPSVPPKRHAVSLCWAAVHVRRSTPTTLSRLPLLIKAEHRQNTGRTPAQTLRQVEASRRATGGQELPVYCRASSWHSPPRPCKCASAVRFR
jgi:hypothetical protein